jgi:RNA polymerase sigma factor (TIGR02999 family)
MTVQPEGQRPQEPVVPRHAKSLLPLVYDELRRLAANKLAHEKPGQTLQATALVHEAYLKLVDSRQSHQWESRTQFFAAAAEAMRRILIDKARRKRSRRHGGELGRVDLLDSDLPLQPRDDDLLALDEALTNLATVDPEASELVNLRIFAGLTIDEIARQMQISPRTAKRNWAFARAWLRSAMGRDGSSSRGS